MNSLNGIHSTSEWFHLLQPLKSDLKKTESKFNRSEYMSSEFSDDSCWFLMNHVWLILDKYKKTLFTIHQNIQFSIIVVCTINGHTFLSLLTVKIWLKRRVKREKGRLSYNHITFSFILIELSIASRRNHLELNFFCVVENNNI